MQEVNIIQENEKRYPTFDGFGEMPFWSYANLQMLCSAAWGSRRTTDCAMLFVLRHSVVTGTRPLSLFMHLIRKIFVSLWSKNGNTEQGHLKRKIYGR